MARRRRRKKKQAKDEQIFYRPSQRETAYKADAILSRQGRGSDEDDPFYGTYEENGLLVPDVDPADYIDHAKRSDAVRYVINAYLANCERVHDFEPTREDVDQDAIPIQKERQTLEDFFNQVNESQHFTDLRKALRQDRMAMGNAYCEVMAAKGQTRPDMMYHVSAKHMRITAEGGPVPTYCSLRRGGETVERVVYRRFRRFARKLSDGSIQWFKQYGDPRTLDRNTGEFLKDSDGNHVRDTAEYPDRATSIWWLKDGFSGDAYGTPLWLAAVTDVRGRYESKWVNFDTLDHGGIPPFLLAILGTVPKGTRDYLKNMFENFRNPETFNEPGVLEIEGSRLGLGTQGRAKADIKLMSLRELRHEDAMFGAYLQDTLKSISLLFGLYSIYHDGSKLEVAMEAEERGAFAPTRQAFDRRTTLDIIQNGFGIFNWKIRTKGSQLGNPEQLYKALGMIGRTGGANMNALLQMQNELFGANWPKYEGGAYNNISAAEFIAMVRGGLITYDEQWNPVVVPPMGAEIPVTKSDDADREYERQALEKLRALGITADVINLATAANQLAEEQERRAAGPELDDDDYIQ